MVLLKCWPLVGVQPLWKTVWRFRKKLKIELPYDPAIALLGIYPKDIDVVKRRAIFLTVFKAFGTRCVLPSGLSWWVIQSCLCSALFIFIGCLSVIENGTDMGLLQPALAHGLALGLIIATLGNIR